MRSVITVCDFRVNKKVKKLASKYTLSVNTAFEAVMEGCIEHHERNWLFPPLRAALSAINSGRAELPSNCPVKVHSVELWNETGELVAGELGYTVGAIYTSMTGFYTESGCGNVQLAALGGLLQRLKFQLWDLGMDMEYKQKLGAAKVPRAEWVRMVREQRTARTDLRMATRTSAKQLIDFSSGTAR